MKVTKSIQDSTLTVQLEGKLDTNTTPLAEQEIIEDVDKADTIIIDMEKLKYISSAGLRLLLILHKKNGSARRFSHYQYQRTDSGNIAIYRLFRNIGD